MQVEFMIGDMLASKNTNPLASLVRFFFPLIENVYVLGQLFSDLASENS
jgi:hypothetical protein